MVEGSRRTRVGERVSVSLISAVLVASILMAVPWHMPSARAGSLPHSNALVDLVATDRGAFADLLWNGVRQTAWDGIDDWMGLVVDHDGYDHTGTDGEGSFLADVMDRDLDNTISPIFWEENTPAKMKSVAGYNHTRIDPGDSAAPQSEIYDVNISQAVYTLEGKSWAILEFAVTNAKASNITNLYVGLYMAVSHRQGNSDYGGLDGDSRDETDGWDGASGTVWIQDDAGTTLGIASALAGAPLDQHYVEDGQAFFRPNDDALFAASNTNQVIGGPAGNRYVLTGFNVGILGPGQTAVFPFILAFNTSEAAVIANDIPDAQSFYFFESLPLLITEFQDSPTSRVELYNDWDSAVDVSGWYLTSSAGTVFTFPPSTVIAPSSHTTVTVSTLGPEADVIALFTNGGIPVDSVGYGWLGRAPDPVDGLSTARVWDAATTSYTEDWTMAVLPGDVSFDAQNPVPAIDDSPYLVLNEISFNPSGGCGGYAELRYIRSTGSIDFTATNYYLAADAVHTISIGLVDTTNLFHYVDDADYPAGFDLDAGADNVYLFDDQGRLLDMVGWNGPHGVDTTVARQPEGTGNHDGYDDLTSVAAGWRFESTPTYARWIALELDTQGGGDPGSFVNYSLVVHNYQGLQDLVDLSVTTEAGWPVTLYDATWAPLGDFNTNGMPDLSVPATSTTPIWASVWVPAVGPGDFENTTLGAISTGRSAPCPAGYDEAVLSSQVFPHLEVYKWADPSVIDVAGGADDTANVTVRVLGGGVPQVEFFPQDTVFLIDSSGSMAWTDPGYLRLEAVDLYMQEMTPEDRAAIVAFGHDYDLEPNPLCTYTTFWDCNFIPTGWLTDDMSTPSHPAVEAHHLTRMNASGLAVMRGNLVSIGPPDHPPVFSHPNGGTVGPATNIEHAMQFAHEELIPGYVADPTTTWFCSIDVLCEVAGRTFPPTAAKGMPGHTWVEILVTDGLPTHPTFVTDDEVQVAAQNGVRIFTVGLLGSVTGNARIVAEDYLRSIADQTGGKFYFADKPEDLSGIYEEIGTVVRDVAAQDPDPSDPAVAMINDVLPDYVELVPGSVNVTSGSVTTSPSPCVPGQACTLRWKLSTVNIGQVENMTYQIRSTRVGPQNITKQPESAVAYVNWNGTDVSLPMPDAWITVIGPVPDIEPPLITDVIVTGSNATVLWQPSPSTHVDYYEVFGGPTPTSIDFTAPLGSTVDAATLSWDHVGGAIADEYYYVVRAVNITGGKASVTSNTAGFFAVNMAAGANAFSLPLEPFTQNMASWYASDMGASWVQWMDDNGQWRDTLSGDIPVEMGKGYVADLPTPVRYVFTGSPGAMILYRDGWGFDASGRPSLNATVDAGGNVTLTWSPVAGRDSYTLVASSTRRGFHGMPGNVTIISGLTNETYVLQGGALSEGAWYYIIIPYSSLNGSGSSTYSVGVWTRTFQGHETFGLPLRPAIVQSVDWYSEAIPNVLGMDFFGNGYWVGHTPAMPAGVYDTDVVMGVGYQITVSPGSGRYSFVGW
jgi:hypothetical protein